MKNKEAPCVDKKCSVCCDPVKVARYFPDDKIPIDDNGERLWTERDEYLAPASHIETVRLRTFDCKNFDRDMGKCRDYENRPEICRNTSCIKDGSDKSVDEQHADFVKEEFTPIYRKGYGYGKKN